MSDHLFPDTLDVRIETARGGFIKRRDDGSVDYVSPLPAPFNYGSVLNTQAADGDPEDCVVLGERLEAGSVVRVRVLGRVRFFDAGIADHKWICGEELRPADLRTVEWFFRFYAFAKGTLNLLRGARSLSHFGGMELYNGESGRIVSEPPTACGAI